VIPFPRDEIRTEEDALDWWEHKFATSCETLGVQVNAAALVREMVSSLRDLREGLLETPISLAEAARRTGYSADHIGRLVREGQIRSVGRKNAPKVWLAECPRKASRVANTSSHGYDPFTDARSLRVRR